ncbi:MAG: RNA 2',3'-cyclic phosphodiesterase [Terriglobales bacterium]
MRLFLAIPVTGSARAGLEAALARWRAAAPEVRWEAPPDWHITLKFLGAWPDADEARLIATLSDQAWPRLRLLVAGLGAFPSLRRPGTLWAGVTPRRPLTPHLTLARVRKPGTADALRGEWRQPERAWGEVEADGMALYQTTPGAIAGARYRIRRHFPAALPAPANA